MERETWLGYYVVGMQVAGERFMSTVSMNEAGAAASLIFFDGETRLALARHFWRPRHEPWTPGTNRG